MKTIINYIKPFGFKIFGAIFIKFSATMIELFLPSILAFVIDDVVPLKQIWKVYMWGGVMILCAVGAWIGNIVANRFTTRISRDITRNIRHDLFEKVSYLSVSQVDSYTIPSLVSRMTSDTYYVHQMVDRIQRMGVRAPIMLIGGIIVTLTLDKALTLVLVCLLPLIGILVYTVSKKGIPLYSKTQKSLDKLIGKVRELMVGVRVIKALSKTEYEKEKFDQINTEAIKNEQKAGTIMAITNPVMSFILNMGLTLVILVGAYRVNSGLMLPGKIIAFLSYFTLILNAMMMLTRLFITMSKGIASANRLSEVFETPSDLDLTDTPHVESEYHIEFKDVSFSYNGVRNNVENVSFAVRQGDTLGILGATGSGKTTIVNLLMRFYDVDSGEILIGGKNIKSIPPEILHTKFGIAMQNDFFFADTIEENIRYGREISRDTMEEAAEIAQGDFIFEKGFDYRLDVGGANLSGGQRQRLLLARAFAGESEIIVLDDSSGALDYKTDAKLRAQINKSFKGVTKIIVAQRISSVMYSDNILFFDNGKIIGSGTHSELLESCEEYRAIYEAQMN